MMSRQARAALDDVVLGLRSWDLWGRLGSQEVRRRYRRTVIGPFWTTLSLGIFIGAMGTLWPLLWHQDPRVFVPYLCSGMIAWTYIATIISEGCVVFVSNEGLIKQLKFSYMTLVCAVVWRNLLVFLHNLIILVAIACTGAIPVNANTLLIVPALALTFVTGTWVVLMMGLVCARFRDVIQVVQSLLQLSMLVTPIFWKPDQLDAAAHHLVDFNILHHYVDLLRGPLTGRAPSALSWGLVTLFSVAGWIASLALFLRFRRRLVYWL